MAQSPSRPTWTWLLVGVGLVTAWSLYLAFFGQTSVDHGGLMAPPSLVAPALPFPADYDWKLQDLEGVPVEFSKFRGKVVFLNIWATWCPPCVAELPSIANLADQRRLRGIEFVCVSTDESAETVRAFLRDKHWPMTMLRATEIPRVFATDGIPATFVIKPDGGLALAQVGSAQWDAPAVVEFLERLASPATAKEASAAVKP